MSLGFYFAELTEAVTTEEAPAGELLRHLLNGLYAVSSLRKPLALARAAFELRLLCSGENGRSLPLCRDSLAALRHAVYGEPKRLYSFTLGPEPLRRLSAAAEAFMTAQLERKFRTLDFFKSLQEPENWQG